MVAIGFSGLKQSVALAAIICGALSGCTSVEQASKADLKATPAVASLPKSATDATANIAAATQPSATAGPATAAGATASLQPGTVAPGAQPVAGAPAMAVATVAPTSPLPAIDQQTGETLAAVAVPMPNPSRQELVFAAAPAANAVAAPVTAAVASPAQLAAGAPATMATTAYAPIPLTPEMTAIQAVVPTPRPGTPAQPTIQLAYAATPQMNMAVLSAMDAAPAMMDFRFDESGPTEVPAALDDSDDDTSGPTVEKSYISRLISKYAKLYEVPESLLHRVVHRESRYNPSAYNKRGYFGLMQIKYNTAKSMGYDGPANGLFDAETNIKYAAKYLRGAWVVADNKEDDAVRLYARGYYYDAKRKGMGDIANGNY